ncbi:MAG: hypothetical protein PVG43_07840 [Nitrosopumilaceae archaeon]|jgi:hypothetical protein
MFKKIKNLIINPCKNKTTNDIDAFKEYEKSKQVDVESNEIPM